VTRVEVKCLLARINGKQIKWGGINFNKGKVVDAIVLANMKSGISIKALDPDECKAKNWKSYSYPVDDPKHCFIAARTVNSNNQVGCGYDNARVSSQHSIIETAMILDAADPDKPISQDDVFGRKECGAGDCPMY
jgi:hypothetical protein